jgi:5-methylcytosine-specific restriction endonuclease McrA
MDEDNLVTACRPCNKRKGGKTPEQAGMVLRPVPLRDVSQ